jgi:hypothetical protein
MQPDRISALRRQPRLGGRVGHADRLIAGRPSRRRPLRRGAGGYGTSSSIDQVVLREREANTAWHLSSDGTLEERLYYCQNWRHDVVALVTANCELRERVRYSSYGIPFGQPLCDCDGDVDVDAADTAILLGAWGTSTPKCDLGLNGTIDATDQSILLGNSGATSGFGELTRNRNRLGHAGYAADGESAERWHAQWRALDSKLGRRTRRDPLGYADGPSTNQLLRVSSLAATDLSGRATLKITATGTEDCSPTMGKGTFKFILRGAPNDCTPVLIQRVPNQWACNDCDGEKCKFGTPVKIPDYWEESPL